MAAGKRPTHSVKKILLAFIFILSFPIFSQAQVGVTLSPWPRMQFLNGSGQILSGGFVHTYISGTSTPQATYTDATGTTQNTNPVQLDSTGSAEIWLAGGQVYRFVVTDANSVQQWVVDGIQGPPNLLSPGPIGTTTPNVVEATYLLTSSSQPALSGLVRMASNDALCWRNNLNSADLCLNKNATDNLLFGTDPVVFQDLSQTFTVPQTFNAAMNALAGGTLTGTFSGNPTLSGNVIVGGSFVSNTSVTSPYFSTAAVNQASTGFLRFSKIDFAVWRNNANSADLPLGINGSDQPQFNSNILPTLSGSVTTGHTATFANSGQIQDSGFIPYPVPNHFSAFLSGDQSISSTTQTAVSGASLSVTIPAGGTYRIHVCYSMSWTTGATPNVDFWVSDGSNTFASSTLTLATSGSNQGGNQYCETSPVTYTSASSPVSLTLYTEGLNSYTVKQHHLYSPVLSGMTADVYASN